MEMDAMYGNSDHYWNHRCDLNSDYVCVNLYCDTLKADFRCSVVNVAAGTEVTVP